MMAMVSVLSRTAYGAVEEDGLVSRETALRSVSLCRAGEDSLRSGCVRQSAQL